MIVQADCPELWPSAFEDLLGALRGSAATLDALFRVRARGHCVHCVQCVCVCGRLCVCMMCVCVCMCACVRRVAWFPILTSDLLLARSWTM